MRISPINSYARTNKNVSFGSFEDKNTRNTMYQTLIVKNGIFFKSEPNKMGFEMMDDIDCVVVYTDQLGKVRAYYDESKIEAYAKKRKFGKREIEYIRFQLRAMEKSPILRSFANNLKKRENADAFCKYLSDIYCAKQYAGNENWLTHDEQSSLIHKSMEERERNSYAQRRAEEEARR